MVEEAVEEVLELVRKAAEDMKANQGKDEFDFMESKELSILHNPQDVEKANIFPVAFSFSSIWSKVMS